MNLKTDIESRKGETVDTVGVALIGGTGIVRQNADDGFLLACGYLKLNADYRKHTY